MTYGIQRGSSDFQLSDGLCSGEHVVGPRAYANVFREVFPAHDSRTIDQKLSGPGYVTLVGTAAGMQQVVSANDFRVRIRKKRECVASLLAQVLRNFRRIHADGYGPDALCLEVLKTFLNSSQLEVAERSPISSIEN